MTPIHAQTKDLQLADVVQLNFATAMPWHTSTVQQIKDGYATLFRPYVHTEDFSYTGGVICYIGIETFEVPMDSREVIILERKTLK